MIKPSILLAVSTLLFASFSYGEKGLHSIASAHDVTKTADRLESILKDKGMTIFNRIDHAAGAKKVGLDLRDTQLIIFGNPKIGTRLMQCQQSTAIDLPLKALVWQDEANKVWISYNKPRYLDKRHNLSECEKVIAKMEKALKKMTSAAAK